MQCNERDATQAYRLGETMHCSTCRYATRVRPDAAKQAIQMHEDNTPSHDDDNSLPYCNCKHEQWKLLGPR